jgi:hypothetical protein
MTRAVFFTASCTALLATFFACDGASTVSPPGCEQNVEVAVTPETTPLFSWAPPCGISGLSVETVPSSTSVSPELVWAFFVSESQPVGPWIRYGQAPTGANVSVAPQSLVTGATYRVRVVQTLGGDVVVGSGERLFTL